MTLASLHRLGTADGVYNYAVENRPHIKAERLRLESSENSVLIAKSALYPSISLSGGYGTGVYSADSDKFWAQMRHNSREYVGLSMNIPDLQPPRHAQQYPLGTASARSQRLALTRSRAGAAQGDRTGVVQRRRGVQQIPFGRRSPASAEVAFATNSRRRNRAVRPFSISTMPRPAWKKPSRNSFRRNTNSYSVRKYWIFTEGNR